MRYIVKSDGSRRLSRWILTLPLLVLLASLTIAQMGERRPERPANFFPQGAIVYVEAKDLNRLLSWWNESDLKATWQESRNYEHFQSSRLYLKLQDRISNWGAEGKFKFSLENLIQASGDQSAVAIYDIGELKMLGATRLPFAKAQTTELWIAHSRFLEKQISNRKYYLEPREGALAFAYVEPYFIVATEESLLAGALSNLEQPAQTLDQSQKWQLCKKQPDSDVALYLDQEALQQNRYFKKYWIHENVKDFSGIRAGWIDLQIESDAITEHRNFVSSTTSESMESNVEHYLEPFRNIRKEALFLDAPGSATNAAEQILRFINRLPEAAQKTSYPPAYSGASERAQQAESKNILLEQIDEPILQVKSETLLQATQKEELAKLLEAAQPAAQIRFGYPLWDSQALFVRFPSSLVLHLQQFDQLNQDQFREQILKHFLLLYSTQDQGGRWKQLQQGAFVLESAHPVYLLLRNPWVLVSNDEQYFQEVASQLPSDRPIPNGSYRQVNLRNGRWKFARLMNRLDHGAYSEDIPLFFSENITSLLDTLYPVTSVSRVSTGNQEMIRYELEK